MPRKARRSKLLLLVRDGLLRALAGSRIVLRVLTADRKSSSVTVASVAADLSKTLDIHSGLTAKITFYRVVFSDFLAELLDFIIGEIAAAGVRIDTCLCKDLICGFAADSINVGEADFDTLTV